MLQPRKSTLKGAIPMPLQSRWLYPNWGCSGRAQSSQCRFDGDPPSGRLIADSVFFLSGVFARPRRKHLRIPNGDDAFPEPCNGKAENLDKIIFLHFWELPS